MKVTVHETEAGEKLEDKDKRSFTSISFTINPNFVLDDTKRIEKLRDAARHFFSSGKIPMYFQDADIVENADINYQLEIGNKYHRTHIQAAMNVSHKYKTKVMFDLKKVNNYWNNFIVKYLDGDPNKKVKILIEMNTDYAKTLEQYVKKK